MYDGQNTTKTIDTGAKTSLFVWVSYIQNIMSRMTQAKLLDFSKLSFTSFIQFVGYNVSNIKCDTSNSSI